MKDLYQIAGISKQAHYTARQAKIKHELMINQIISQVEDVRSDHPAMGCRKIYTLIGDQVPTGRDRFENILLDRGFRVRYPPNYIKTTRSHKDRYFENLISDLELDNINQVWQSDIAYIWIGGRFYYLVFIIDVYSRRLLGYQAHPHMLAIANVKALKQALKTRGGASYPNLIHHSDRGSQYIESNYVKLQESYQITPSMGKYCWENAYAERINGTIKNEYLSKMDIKSYAHLKRALNRVVNLYNHIRPHDSLHGKLAPVSYEQALENREIQNIPMRIYNSELSTY